METISDVCSLAPLPPTKGAIQRGVTKSVKQNGGKQAFSRDKPTNQKVEGKAPEVHKLKAGTKAHTSAKAWENKKEEDMRRI